MKTIPRFGFATIKPQGELTTRQRARAIAHYMQDNKSLIEDDKMEVKSLPQALQEFADASESHHWDSNKQQLKLNLENSAYIKIYPCNDELVKIKAKGFVYGALALKELATQLNTLADVMEKRHDNIKEALAQPDQEPVARVQDLDEVKRKHLVYEKGMDWKDFLYTAPPQRNKT